MTRYRTRKRGDFLVASRQDRVVLATLLRSVRKMNGSQSRGYSDLSILGLDRWKNIFSFADINPLPQAAMANAVAEVNQHTDG